MVCQVLLLLLFNMVSQSQNQTLFTKGTCSDFVALLVYVDYLILTGPSQSVIESLKDFLHGQFKLKDLGSLKYFLGLKIARYSQGLVLSQRQYTLQLLEDTGYLACKPAPVPMDPKSPLIANQGDLLDDPSSYR